MLEDLKNNIDNCKKCPNLIHCKEIGMNPAVSLHSKAKIMFIGLNPGSPLETEKGIDYDSVLYDSRVGKMFVQKFLEKSGYSYEDIYWNNLCKCASPENREITDEEIDNCFSNINEQIKELPNLKYIVLLGNKVKDYISLHPLDTKASIIAMKHPSWIFRTSSYGDIDTLAERVTQEELGEIVNVYYDNWGFKEKYRIDDKVRYIDRKFNNYFYVLEKDLDRVLDLVDMSELKLELNYDRNSIYKTIDGREVIKIYCNFYYHKFTKFLKEQGVELFENDLSPYVKYIVDNKIKFGKNRRFFFLDIENEMCNTPFFPEKPITCIGIYDSFINRYKIFTFSEVKEFNIRGDCDVLVYDTEEEMLVKFIDYVVETSPDIILSWYGNDFDIPYIIMRCKKLGIEIDRMSNSNERPKIKCELWEDKVTLKIGGIDCVDLMPVLQRVTGYMQQPSNYDLSSVCSFFLGEEYVKNDFNLNDYKAKFKEFLEYNLRDIELLKFLNTEMGLLNYILLVQSEVVPCVLSNITYNSYLLEMYLKLKNPEIILLDKKEFFKIGDNVINLKTNRVKIKGAFTGRMVEKDGIIDYVDPIPGIFKNVEVIDFSGFYASLYSSYNLSLENLNKGGELVIKDIEADILESQGQTKYGEKETQKVLKSIKFESSFDLNVRGLIPKIIDEIRSTRKIYQNILKTLDKDKNKLEYQKNKALQDSFKVLGNAFYGVFSYNGFRLYNPYLNGAITKLARDGITFVNQEILKLGYTPLYSDTDSTFVFKNGEEINIKELLKIVNEKLKEHVVSQYPKLKDWYCVKVDHAYSFKTLVFKEAKKRYFGILKSGEFWTKGFEIIRRDTPKKIKPILKQLFIDLLYNDKKQMKAKLIEIKKYIYSLSYQDLGITLTISRDLDSYLTNTQHIRGALYSIENFGKKYKSGDKVKLIFTSDTGKYPKTDVICIDNEFELPSDFKIDYKRFYDFLIVKKLELLDGIKEFDINYLVNENKTLEDFGIKL